MPGEFLCAATSTTKQRSFYAGMTLPYVSSAIEHTSEKRFRKDKSGKTYATSTSLCHSKNFCTCREPIR